MQRVLANGLVPLMNEHPWLLAGGLLTLAMLVLGFRDVVRLSLVRTWAIASVCFRQSIRRRVLWLTPLVIAGVIVVAQFQKPVDAQDVVRQTTGYCLFAAGLLLTVVIILLACTNLPREIETRVIYTVATKPTTRLEIVLGKVVGFACVSFWILVIMGLFTYGYLRWQDFRQRQAIEAQLPLLTADSTRRPTLEYYREHGTLHARAMATPEHLSLFARMPQHAGDLWCPSGEGEMLIPFDLDPSQIPPPQEAPGGAQALGPGLGGQGSYPGGLILLAKLKTQPNPDRLALSTAPSTQPVEKPQVIVDLRNSRREMIVHPKDLNGDAGLEISPSNGGQIELYIHPQALNLWMPPTGEGSRRVWVAMTGLGAEHEYSVRAADVRLVVPLPDRPWAIAPSGPAVFTAHRGPYGHQLRGSNRDGKGRVAIYSFRDETVAGGQDNYTFEMRLGIEPDRSEWDMEEEVTTHIVLDFFNQKNKSWTRGIEVQPESNRPSYFQVPAAAVEGGTFDVYLRMASPGWLGLEEQTSLRMVLADQNFGFNLLKSLAILWLLAVLVTIVSIFCSTFLSWPIAVVLTLVILAGHWGTQQLGDLAQPGVGRQIVSDMLGKGASPGTSRAVSESVDALVIMLSRVSSVLPDIGQFAAIEDIQRGLAIRPATLLASLQVTLGFGIPLLILSYLLLKYKEVAP